MRTETHPVYAYYSTAAEWDRVSQWIDFYLFALSTAAKIAIDRVSSVDPEQLAKHMLTSKYWAL